MLVLSRNANEGIRIGNDVRVSIVRISGNKVRIGIEAPDDVVVLRDELVVEASSSDSATPGDRPS
jgi:carbon storage regulator